MALDYTVYYKKSKVDLEAVLDRFIKSENVENFFLIRSTHETNPMKNEIVNEMGYGGSFPSHAFFRLNKFHSSEATNALKIFRDKYLGSKNAVFLLEGETELSL